MVAIRTKYNYWDWSIIFSKINLGFFYTSDIVFRNNLVKIDMKTLRDNSGTTAEIISKINKLHTFCAKIIQKH